MPQKRAAGILQRDIPLCARPFAAIAETCGLTGGELINWIKELSREGILRKFGAIVRHQKAGYEKNALVMWAVPPGKMEETGRRFASLPFISHCYERSPAFQGRYTLFTMLHSRREAPAVLIAQMAQAVQCPDFLILESLQEYKKTSPEYFE